MATDREGQLLNAAVGAGITDRRELANFMAQVGHESGGLARLEESFRYTRSAEQVASVVRSAMREGRPALEAARLEALQGRPEALAELMYGGRMGNDEPGDGYRFRGRGYIQLTGRDNYRAAGEALGLDLERNPQLAAEPENAARIAVWYWQTRVPQAARDDVREAGARINGSDPPNGLADRERRFERWERTITPEMMDALRTGQVGRPADPARTPPQAPSAPRNGQPTSFQDVMNVMLPPQDGVRPHMTSDYGPRTLNGRHDHHGGVDFNYVGGQNGINLRHPEVRSPVSGTVIYGAGQGSYGTVKIRDDQGNVHEILHLDSRSVRATNPPTRIEAGDVIGTMGGRGPNGASQYAQHVHYQVRDPSGRTVDPEEFWRGRRLETPGTTQPDDPRRSERHPGHPHRAPSGAQGAMADGVLRQGERGDDIIGLQQNLNRLGYRDARGRPLEEDGRFGPNTRHAVEAYQRDHGLKIDGIAGPRTLASIGQQLPDGRVTVEARVDGPVAFDRSHPQAGRFAQLVQGVDALPPNANLRASPQDAGAALLQATVHAGFDPNRPTRVVAGRDPGVVFAVQGEGDAALRVRVDTATVPPGTAERVSAALAVQPALAVEADPQHQARARTV